MPEDSNGFGNINGETLTDTDIEIKKPGMYRVLIHNDHYSTMDFVVEILMKIFHKSAAEATKLMLDVHHKGVGVAGLYPLDIAITKVNEVHKLAKLRNFPLRCSYEEV